MSEPAVSVVVPTVGAARLERLLDSLARQTAAHQTIVVDNGTADGAVASLCERHGVQTMRLETNAGYSRACNLAAAAADGDWLVLLNDDCVCEPRFLAELTAALDPAAGIAMAAAVMRDWANPELIDSAGMELDRTLLVYDYLNGEPLSRLQAGVADPIGPSGAAAAFERRAFLEAGGFDERLFAYWEDVDLVLRMRRGGLRCRLAAGARGVHEHSATLGSGSARKNYLMGFGRGYVLRKWRVLGARRLAAVLVRDGALCAGQALVDRNLAGVRGRLDGYRAASPVERYPAELASWPQISARENLRRRARRRARLRVRRRPGEPRRALAVFHLAETSGPSRSLERELAWLAGETALELVVPDGRPPACGGIEHRLAGMATVHRHRYQALTAPARGRGGPLAHLRRIGREIRSFRALLAERRPELVVVVTSMLPAAAIAAALARVPTLIYCGELFDRGYGAGPMRALAGRLLAALTGRLADSIVACSQAVAEQFDGVPTPVRVVYPPISGDYAGGDGAAFRAAHGFDPEAPLIAAVGYLTEGRAQDVLIEALPAIHELLPEARLVIAGDPFARPQDLAYRRHLSRLIDRHGLHHAVVLAGHVERVADLYAAADVVVNPARVNEAFGRVAFEAAIAGRPAAVTAVGAVAELLRDRESALIVEPDDPPALAAAVIELLNDPELGQRLVAGARGVVDEHLRPEHSLAGFQRAVAETLPELSLRAARDERSK